MMKRAHWIMALAALSLAACGPQAQQDGEPGGPSQIDNGFGPDDDERTPLPPLPQVDGALLEAPTAQFMAIEPSELGVFAAPAIEEAIDPLIGSPEAHEEGASVSLTIREGAQTATVDIVRSNIPDDSVAAGHVRIEFRREPEGWFPTNAYRRSLCRRGERAGQWTRELCP